MKFSGAIVLLTALIVHNAQAQIDMDLLPELHFDDYVCGTTILMGLLDLDEIENYHDGNNQQSIYDIQQSSAEVGDRREFKVYNFEESGVTSQYDPLKFELRAMSELSEIWVEVGEWEGEVNQEVVDKIMHALEESTPAKSIQSESGIIDININTFGEPPNKQGTGRLKVLLVDIQDGWDPDNGGGYIAGFFNPTDQQYKTPLNYSNEADIIYIDTYPGIYRPDSPPDPERPLNVLAHEHQHLIHYRYGNLNVFQNEGQSELSEILTGYDARSMHFLEDPDELSGNVSSGGGPSGLYRWRRDDMNSILMDYQRAGLFHAFLKNRLGAEAAGLVTQAENDGFRAYEKALNEGGISWSEFLADFYLATWLNDPSLLDGRYAYHTPQHQNISVEGIGADYTASNGMNLEETEVELHYGSVKYTRWKEIEDLELHLIGETGIAYHIIRQTPDDVEPVVEPLSAGSHEFIGDYDFIVLVALNNTPQSPDDFEGGSRIYSYSTGTATAKEEITAIKEFKLMNNYPNPFNPTTTIRYQLPEQTDVKLAVFSAEGRHIRTIVDENQNPGSYHISFDGSGLASGVYIYRLRAGDFSDSGKMILVK